MEMHGKLKSSRNYKTRTVSLMSNIECGILMFISLWKGSFDTLSFRIMDS